ncbi:MAG: DUF3524 domain-containing protein [Kangiellaceae bacterium]|jgi:glycosyltransferase involved in cell wall biosynthesis|nr:DUF3524 domain-containing protein [Kangiellaceae bacterium]
MTKQILLLSAYDAPSHRYWREGISSHLTDFNWQQLHQPARHFAWRSRGNSLIWGTGDYPQLNQDYNLIVATSMTDISALRGLRPNLATSPLLVYFHENQFDYPTSDHQRPDVNIPLTSIYSAFCADKIVFNSQYNRATFLSGAAKLLAKLPDLVPTGIIEHIKTNSSILPVPLFSDNWVNSTRTFVNSDWQLPARTTLDIVWNHRWEYDKNPDEFFAALTTLKQRNIPFKLRVMGQQFRHSPKIFEHAKLQFAEHIVCWGYQSREQYWQHLTQANVAVSSALHDFQGLSLQEAIACGCVPVAANRVAYPEYIPEQLLYKSNQQSAQNLATKLIELYNNGLAPIANTMAAYQWPSLREKYQSTIESLI